MDLPSLKLSRYTFPFGIDGYSSRVNLEEAKDSDGFDVTMIRSVELASIGSSYSGCALVLDGEYNIVLEFPKVERQEGENFRKLPLSFVIGYTDYTTEDYDELDVKYVSRDMTVYATSYADSPTIDYIENLASKVTESAGVVIHGHNMTDGLSVILSNGETDYVVFPDEISFDIDSEGVGTASFTVFPGMLAQDGDGKEPCAQYVLNFGYGDEPCSENSSALMRYKYDSETDAMQAYSTESVTREKACYETGTMSMVYDTTDEFGNAIQNPESDPRFGDTVYMRVDRMNCDQYFYTMVRVKYNKNLVHKAGLLKLNGVQLRAGDVVWLAGQIVESENGLWVVDLGDWYGFNNGESDAPLLTYRENLPELYGLLELDGIQLTGGDIVMLENQYDATHNGLWVVQPEEWVSLCTIRCAQNVGPMPVDDTVLVDLGARGSYPVDYVCGDDVPYKCGTRTICNYIVEPGKVVALYNQKDGTDGIYLVACGDWVKLGDVDKDDLNGINVDMTNNIISQNNIDFCDCGGTFYIDYFLLMPSCYMHHLRRTVKILCGGASIVPNTSENQVKISEYVVKVGEEDALIGNRGRTPGDPVKEDCTKPNEDIDVDFGLGLIEHRQYIPDPVCYQSPACTTYCDFPRVYTLRMPKDYTNSNDRNGFTIKFWRHENDGWHLYAYIGSGTQLTGMHYYVYHLFVDAKATEAMVDVNDNYWFTENGGIIAGEMDTPAEEFALFDDKWDFVSPCKFCHGTGKIDGETCTYCNGTGHDLDPATVRHGILDDDFSLHQNWRISCTTSIFAHYLPYEYEHEHRVTCADMEDAEKEVLAIGDMCTICDGTGEIDGATCTYCNGTGRDPEGYLVGVPHIFGVAYYNTVMTKAQFVDEYNKYDSDCVRYEILRALRTDDDTEITNEETGDTDTGIYIIGTDDHKGLRT